MKALPSNCLDCPLARHLYADRFACGNNLNKVVRGHHPSTAECHDAVLDFPHRYFHPSPLPDLRGLEPEWICDSIHLGLNWLDVHDDSSRTNKGDLTVEVSLQDSRIGYLRRNGDTYYCDRTIAIRSPDAYWLALHLINPDYLYRVPDEIVAARSQAPEYF